MQVEVQLEKGINEKETRDNLITSAIAQKASEGFRLVATEPIYFPTVGRKLNKKLRKIILYFENEEPV